MQDEAALFKALSDPIRLRLAVLLALRGETCVCELAVALGEPDYKISRHLGVLRAAGAVQARREGAWMHYRLADSGTALATGLWQCLRECLNDHPTVRDDLARLQKGACGKTAKDPGDCVRSC